jgi:hypothetical protein
VYLSNFGESRLAEEKNHGPKKVFEKLKQQYKKKGLLNSKNIENSNAISQMINNDPLVRQYEIDRLKYYYAVLEFENEEVTDWIYSNCDGLEFEKSGMQIDLRGIEQDLVIPKEPTEVADRADDLDPKALKKKKIKNLAKNHTHVELTWGEEKNQYDSEVLFDKEMEDLNETELRNIIASDSEEEEETEKSGKMRFNQNSN